MHSISKIALAISAFLMLPLAAAAREGTDAALVGASQDWSVFRASDPQACWIATMPSASTHRRDGARVDVTRDDIRLYLTAAGEDLELSFVAGYLIDADAGVELSVKGQGFPLVSEGSVAWARDADQQAEIISQMKRAGVLRITASSERGTRTVDTFSMMGFSAALEKAIDACS